MNSQQAAQSGSCRGAQASPCRSKAEKWVFLKDNAAINISNKATGYLSFPTF